jgi:hypothetical protein
VTGVGVVEEGVGQQLEYEAEPCSFLGDHIHEAESRPFLGDHTHEAEHCRGGRKRTME